MCSLEKVFLSQNLGGGKVGGECKDGENQTTDKEKPALCTLNKGPREINATLTAHVSVPQWMGMSVERYWFGGQKTLGKLFIYFEHPLSHL